MCSQIRCVWLVTRGEVEVRGAPGVNARGIQGPHGTGVGRDGGKVGVHVGPGEGGGVGKGVGKGVGGGLGSATQHPVFRAVGTRDGAALGAALGAFVGPGVGPSVGPGDGPAVGIAEGAADGISVGRDVGGWIKLKSDLQLRRLLLTERASVVCRGRQRRNRDERNVVRASANTFFLQVK